MRVPIERRSVQTIAVLAITQLIGWGTSFEVLGVMGRVIAPELGLANEIIFAGLSVMMLVSALVSPKTGRLLARHGAAKVLAASSLVFAIGLSMLALSHGIVVYSLAWVVIGIGGSLGLSAPAYTAVVEREGPNASRIIAILMLFTGLSVTIFWPLLSVFNDAFGWRMTFAACAALQILVCLPLYLLALPKPLDNAGVGEGHGLPPVPLEASERRIVFLLIAGATTISSFATFGLSPSLLELLRQEGATLEFALQLAAARGVLAIAARGVDMLLGKRGNPMLTSLAGSALMILGFLSLLTITPSPPLLIAFIMFYGFGSGILTVARALLPLSVFSRQEYGLQASRLALPQNLANATAPVIFTALLDRAGSQAVLALCLGLCLLSLAMIVRLMMVVRRAKGRMVS